MSVTSDDVYDNGDVRSIVGGESRTKKRQYYPSNKDGYYIVNAVTGHRYPWKVGSYNSYRLYKVTDSTGFNDRDGYRIQKNDDPNYEPNFLYYDSPEQASKHLRTKLDPRVALEWHNQYNIRFPNGELDPEVIRA